MVGSPPPPPPLRRASSLALLDAPLGRAPDTAYRHASLTDTWPDRLSADGSPWWGPLRSTVGRGTDRPGAGWRGSTGHAAVRMRVWLHWA